MSFDLLITLGYDERDVDPEDEEKKVMKYQSNSLQDVRKSLPIFVYRDGLLDAIEKYQVLVVVGETGTSFQIL